MQPRAVGVPFPLDVSDRAGLLSGDEEQPLDKPASAKHGFLYPAARGHDMVFDPVLQATEFLYFPGCLCAGFVAKLGGATA